MPLYTHFSPYIEACKTIASLPVGGILRRAHTKLHGLACLYIRGEMGIFMQVLLPLLHSCQQAHPRYLTRAPHHGKLRSITADRWREMKRGRRREREVCQQLVSHKIGRVNNRSCQRLIQIGDGSQQAHWIGERPLPAAMFRENEGQSPRLSLAAAPRPEQHGQGTRRFLPVRM